MSWKINAIPFQLYDEEQQIHLIHLCRKKGPKGSCSLLLLCASFPVNRSTPFLKVRILTSFFTNVTDAIVIRFQRNLLFFFGRIRNVSVAMQHFVNVSINHQKSWGWSHFHEIVAIAS